MKEWEGLVDDAPVAGGQWTPPPAARLRPARRRLLLGLGTVPWLALGIGLLVRPPGSGSPPPSTAAASPTVADGSASPDPIDASAAPPVAVMARTPLPVTAVDDRLAATALLAAHASVRAQDRYVDHAAVERVLHPTPDAAVVVVLAVVLDRVDDGWSAPRTIRVGVPIAFAGGVPTTAGAPWPLPHTPTAPVPLDVVPDDDPALATALGRALDRTGWTEVQVRAVGRTDRWPVVADVAAVAPGSTAQRDHHLWFETTGDGWRLIGDESTPTPEDATP